MEDPKCAKYIIYVGHFVLFFEWKNMLLEVGTFLLEIGTSGHSVRESMHACYMTEPGLIYLRK